MLTSYQEDQLNLIKQIEESSKLGKSLSSLEDQTNV